MITQRFTNGIVIKSTIWSWLGTSFPRPVPFKTPDMLEVKAIHRNKLVEYTRLFRLLASCVTLRNRPHQFISRRHAHTPHLICSCHPNAGSRSDEATA